MGIPHTVRLILPRIMALAIAMPLLILWTSGIALIGGAIAASTQLGISVNSFMSGLPGAVPTVNIWLAMGKGVVFGALIALVACHFGLRVQPNTESLGIGTNQFRGHFDYRGDHRRCHFRRDFFRHRHLAPMKPDR